MVAMYLLTVVLRVRMGFLVIFLNLLVSARVDSSLFL